jgi:ribosomal-protein-alanine N-acetyltransferase
VPDAADSGLVLRRLIPEQRALEKAGFTLEGVIRAAEFRAGQWRDGYLYSRLRTDHDPLTS